MKQIQCQIWMIVSKLILLNMSKKGSYEDDVEDALKMDHYFLQMV